ncbi:gliding motility-associated C-terminal domain-containing protein [Hymenobacter sp. B81]|uniref:DUF7948 domain-containing protein n=1 Tax=Hymenobacter sp. B81 TaxID=3344878 RepID=UPI0037DCF04E
MEFVEARPSVQLQALAATGEVRNYLLGNDARAWAAGVDSYRQLRYRGLWPGIDAHLYENQQGLLEYDFEVAAGADVGRIRQRYTGADELHLLPDGGLELRTSVGRITELRPQAWQLDAHGRREPVSCRYVLRGQEVSFRLGAYDPRRPLTIDPTVVFSTFAGSTADNWGFTATYDQQGNMYSGGIVFGLGYPASPGAYSTSFSGNIDIALIKYNTTATGPASRVWATYLGGSSGDFPQSLVVNSQGELIILGTTGSLNYPTTGDAFSRSFNGGNQVNPYSGVNDPVFTLAQGTDLIITRLSANGSVLRGLTFLGGSSNEGLLTYTNMTGAELIRNYGDQFRGDVLVDPADNIYIASNTTSPNFPTRNNFQTARGGGIDAVVCKLTPNLDNLVWSSYLGGGQPDAAYSLQLDASGRLFVCGGTTSLNFPVTSGALQNAHSGLLDGFLVRISASGGTLERSTFVGTPQADQAYFVQLDGSGAPYLLGQTLGDYPTTPGRYINTNSRQFIHKLNADLTTTDFATVFGSGRGTIDISPTAFLVDQCGRIYVSGWGGGQNTAFGNGVLANMPLAGASVQTTTDGSDFYLLQLSADATRLEYATYFGGGGGDHVDGGTARFDRRGFVYQAVCGGCGGSSSFPFPAGAGSYSTTNPSTNCNNAAFKFDFEPERAVVGPNREVCRTAPPLALGGSPAGGVWTGLGVSSSPQAGYVFTPAALPLGPVTLSYTVTNNTCISRSQLELTVVAPPTATFQPLPQDNYCIGSTAVALTATPAGGTFSGPGVTNNTFNPSMAGPGTHTLRYVYTLGGCSASATQTVSVIGAAAGPDLALCTPTAAVPLVGTPAGGVWSGQYVVGNAPTGYFFAPPVGAAGRVALSYTLTAPSGCTSSSTRQVTLTPKPVVGLPSATQFCVGSTTALALPGNASWSGPGVLGLPATGFTFTPNVAGVGQHTLAYTSVNGDCDFRGSITMTVNSLPSVVLPTDTALCPGSRQPFRLRGSPAGGTWSGANVTPDGLFTPPAGFSGAVSLVYSVQNNSCVATASRRVFVAALPAMNPSWTADGCPQNRDAPLLIHFRSIGAPSTTAVWDFGDGTTATGQAPDHVYQQPGRYQPRLTVWYNNGRCQFVTQLSPVEVNSVALVPNVVTPNGDDRNETFRVPGSCPPRLQVFSRWGAKVYESASYANDWGGGSQPAGSYYYLLTYPGGRTVKGWLEIVR